MPTKRQHFVPRVYIKAWETVVTNKNEPNKKFQGVYYHGMNGSDGKQKRVYYGNLTYIQLDLNIHSDRSWSQNI